MQQQFWDAGADEKPGIFFYLALPKKNHNADIYSESYIQRRCKIVDYKNGSKVFS